MTAATISTEEEPLLSNGRPTSRKHNSTIISQTHSPKVIILLLFCIIFVLAFGGGLMGVPGIRIYEDIICHQYYDNLEGSGRIGLLEEIDESLCKIDAVQNQMNFLLAVLHFLGAIPSLVTTIPYGLLADRVGRKPVFVLSMTGMIIGGMWNLAVMRFWTVLPLRLIWLSPVFILIGGGEAVAGMMFFAVGSDIISEANRANVFLFGGSAGLFATLFAPSLASTLMLRSPWIPLLLGLGLLMIGTSLIIFIPETLHLRLSSSEELIPDSSSDLSTSSTKLNSPSFFVTLKTQITNGLKRLYASTTVLRSLPVLLLLCTFITIPFDRQSIDLSIRYISNRFSWKLREAGYLLSLRAFINIILLLVILPGISYYLTERRHFSSKAKDLLLARVSAVVLLVGALLIALSPTIGLTIVGLIVWTLGTGFGALTRALITTLVDKEHVGRLYAAIAVVESSSALAAGPTLAALYSLGLKLKGPWVGLPFFCLAVITFVSGLGVWCFGFLKKKQDIEEMPYGDEERETVVGNTVLLEPDSFESGTINVV